MNHSEMREKIARILIDASVDNEVFATTADRIQSLYDSEGFFRKSEKQVRPENPYDYVLSDYEKGMFQGFNAGQQSMLDAGYVLPEKDGQSECSDPQCPTHHDGAAPYCPEGAKE